MMRKGIVNGNGYECDICHKNIRSHDVMRVSCSKTVGHSGATKRIDSMGVCEKCYVENFPYLAGRGLLRDIKNKNSSD